MTRLALAFATKKIVVGWIQEFGGRYRNAEGWTAVPVTFRGEFKGLSVFDEKGEFIGIVKSANDLP